MLQEIRERARGVGGWIILGAIVFVLSVFGFGAFNVFVGGEPAVATVGDRDIGEQELAQAVERRRRQVLARMGEDADPSQIDEDALRGRVLEGLIERQLLLEAADAQGMAVPSQMVGRTIRSMEQFRTDGSFDAQRYRAAVRSTGMSAEGFQQAVAEDIRLQHLVSGIADTAFLTSDRLNAVVALLRQRRDIAWLRLPTRAVRDEIQISESAAREFYANHPDQFRQPERVAIRYVRLSREALQSEVEVSAAALREAYRKEVQAREGQQQRSASHILLEVNAERSEQEARRLARQLGQRLKHGASFSELASQYSDDAGSARQGGDLGFSTRDAYAPAFADALWALEPGELSQPVRTEFGVHLIRLNEVTDAEPPSFEAMRSELETRVRQRKAEARFTELKRQLETRAYEAEDLTAPAQALGLDIRGAGPFSREGGDAALTGRQSVVEAAFSAEVLEQGYNSAVLEPEPGVAIVLRVAEHLPARKRPFEEVSGEVRETLRHRRATEQVAVAGRSALAELREGRDTSAVAADRGVEWKRKTGVERGERAIPGAIVRKAFTLARPADGKSLGAARLRNGDFAVVAVTDVRDGDTGGLSDQARSALSRRMRARQAEVELAMVRTLLRQAFPVERDEG